MEKRISVVNIIIEDSEAVSMVNEILHSYGSYAIGRLGLPYAKKNLAVICLVLDCPPSVCSALSGKLGMIKGVMVKTMTAKV
ncbi:MAG: iron-only hydrogenase system regulator [Eubacteriaceae bacterium]|nr:iron-only hydrogenase system regulator [Eubacteriaceae bacterium]